MVHGPPAAWRTACVFVVLLAVPAAARAENHEIPGPAGGPAVTREVLGFYPYWIPTDAYTSFDFSLLTTIAWSNVNVQADGTIANPHGWPNTGLQQAGRAAGVRVVLVVGSVDGLVIDSVLASHRQGLSDNILSLIQATAADGVNIDLEGISAVNSVSGEGNRDLVTVFMRTLSDTLWSANASLHISIDLPDVDWTGVFDGASLSAYANYLMIMGYDVHWCGDPVAGSVAPLDGGNFNIRQSVRDYAATIPRDQLLLGVPYYGYVWPTVDDDRLSPTTGSCSAHRYTSMRDEAARYGRRWDDTWKTPWYAYQSDGQWYQGHYDDAESLAYKYDLVNTEDLAGIGIWALGYDAGATELWALLREKFVAPEPDDSPGEPTLSAAALSGTNVVIAFSRSADDGAGENDVVAYRVFRSSVFASAGAGYTSYAGLPAGSTSFTDRNAGIGDTVDYFYCIRAEDSIGQLSGCADQAAKNYRLYSKGRHLLSIPTEQHDTAVSTVFQTLDWKEIRTYGDDGGVGRTWRTKQRLKPGTRDLDVTPQYAFLVNVGSDSSLVTAGIVRSTVAVPLKTGWNFVGYGSFITRTVSSALAGVTYTRVEGSDGPSAPYRMKKLNGPDFMGPFDGFWIHVRSDQTWVVTN